MSSRYFDSDYSAARAKFLDAAATAGAHTVTHAHPLQSPDGEPLAADVAWIGPDDAQNAVLLVSGTHGVEGFCGSACQTAVLDQALARELPPKTALVMIHALNPYGFAYLRRVTEDNVDLNRNFADYDRPLPENRPYSELHDWLVPNDWLGSGRAAADAEIDKFVAASGLGGLQVAVSSGQYHHPDGLFFGGAGPTWSRRIFERICRGWLNGLERLIMIDFHTGLGPRGHGELIVDGHPESGEHARAKTLFGSAVTSPEIGDSVSPPLHNTIRQGVVRTLPKTEITAVTLEYGVIPMLDVFAALRAEQWLTLHGDVNSVEGRRIKAALRDAFYGDDDDWKRDVWQRAEDIVVCAIRGLGPRSDLGLET